MLQAHVNLSARFGIGRTTMSENEFSVLAVPKNLGPGLDLLLAIHMAGKTGRKMNCPSRCI